MSVSVKVSVSKMLREWRQVQAAAENVELYRILQNDTINLISELLPETNIDLLDIKGLGPKKVQKYGQSILDIVIKASVPATGESISDNGGDDSLSVIEFLSRINYSLAKHTVRIYGEVYGSVDTRGKAIYFKIKDTKQNAILSCFAWADTFADKGVFPTEGAEVVLEGQVQIYPPTGRFSLQVKLLELRGEGLLRAAYDKLRKDLESAGSFDTDRKRALKHLPRRVALITAAGSDAETDFITHIGNYGIAIDRYDVRVEGIRSETEIIKAFKRIAVARTSYDVVVVTRGGGSLESLQSYNSRGVIDCVLASRYPVISAVGHEKDVTLCDLVADIRTSTPTDAGKYIDSLYQDYIRSINNNLLAVERFTVNTIDSSLDIIGQIQVKIARDVSNIIKDLNQFHRNSLQLLKSQIEQIRHLIDRPQKVANTIKVYFSKKITLFNYRLVTSQTNIVKLGNITNHNLRTMVENKQGQLAVQRKVVENTTIFYRQQFDQNVNTQIETLGRSFIKVNTWLNNQTRLIENINPERILKRGYSIVTDMNNKVIKSSKQISDNTKLNIRVIDGTISAVTKA